MAPLPEENTARIRVRYHDQWNEHTMTFRFVDMAAPATNVAIVRSVITSMLPLLWDNVIFDGAEMAVEGSNIFNEVSGWTPMNATGQGTPGANVSPSRFMQFGGRSSDGRKVKLYLFGVRYDEVQDMRYSPADLAAVGDVIDQLTNSSEIVTIGGITPVWKQYANYGFNDLVTRKARG